MDFESIVERSEDIISPDIESGYSEIVEAAQEYERAVDQYKAAVENYNETVTLFKTGSASPVEMKNAMDQFAQADNKLMNAGLELEYISEELQIEFGLKMSEDDVVAAATENTLAKEKIKETTERFSSSSYDFLKSLVNIENIARGDIDTTLELMERDEEYLSENLEYSWDDAMDKASDTDFMEETEQIMESFALESKRKDIIEKNPNDRYLGGIKSKTGTKDLKKQREKVLGKTDLVEKRKNVLGTDEQDLKEARDRVQGREPRYIH